MGGTSYGQYGSSGGGGGSGGVTSLNAETGDINLTSVDSSVTITPSGQTIDLSAAKGTVTAVTGTAPVVSSGGTTPAISMPASTNSVDGYLTAVDHTTFAAKQAAGNYITALTGDVTASGPGSVGATLVATSNSTLTALSGLTTAASLASVGTITSGTWNGTTVAVNHGGTGQITAAAAFNALSPITTTGDMIYSPAGATSQRLAVGSTGNVLTVSGGVPTWAPPATAGTVTAVSVASANGLAGSSSGGATPALTLSTTITGILKGNGTAISAASSGTDYQAPITSTTPVSHQFLTGFTSPNTFAQAQPAFTDVSGTATVAQMTISTQAISSTAIDWSTGTVFTQSNGATSRTFTFSNQTSGQTIVVRLTQTSGSVTWPTVKWPGGSAPTATASGTDVYTFIYDGTSTYGSAVQNMS